MNKRLAGWILAIVHVLLALSVAGKYLYDRETLPRVWTRADAESRATGHYVRFAIEVDFRDRQPNQRVALAVVNGRLTARLDPESQLMLFEHDGRLRLHGIQYYFPADAPDTKVRGPGEELWVEVSVPDTGLPRALRLGVRRDGGAIEPLDVTQ